MIGKSRFTWLAGIPAAIFLVLAGPTKAAPGEPAVKSVRACGDHAPAAGFASCHARIVVMEDGKLLQSATPDVSGYGPTDLRTAYNITGNGKKSTIIVVVDAFHYPTAEADLGVYRAQFGLPPCTKANGCFHQVDQRGGQHFPPSNLGWNQEAALDIEMVSAACPNCTIALVEADDNSYNNLAIAVNNAAKVRGVHAISNSYGGGEQGTTPFEPSYNHDGIAITASTGDSGFGPQFPASSPHVVAVGGTSLTRDSSARGFHETVWSGAGSGCSTVYAKQSWQTDPLCAKRTIGDVSAVANPATGVAVYGPIGSGSTWLVFGGTSVSAPFIAGSYGVANTPVHYGSDPYAHTTSFFDVVGGANGSCGNYLCQGVAGYDGPTGWGTPNGVGGL